MRNFRFMRVTLLALFLCLIPVSSSAAVFISVGFAPPSLPVYEQPLCPEAGWMWIPGYWAYGDDGYFWVPGTWVPAPYIGALWTPGYWGWGDGLYVWHPGYWGPHVGYYGGVDYGFGFFGVGFAGGEWRGGVFAYNTAVWRVNTRVIRNTYEDRTVIQRNTIVNNNRVAYSGGPGGIRHDPTPQENAYSHEKHMAATSYQVQHRNAAMQDRGSYYNNNHGHPNNVAVDRPMNAPAHGSFNNNAPRPNNNNNAPGGRGNQAARPQNNGGQGGGNQGHGPAGGGFNNNRGQNNPQPQPQFQPRNNPPQPHAQPQPQFQPRNNPPQPHAQPQPQPHNAPQPRGGDGGGGGGGRDHGKGH